jgi:hypothetical protein
MKPVFKPSYLTAAIASAGILALYVATLGPSTAQWDTSEYIAVAHVLGLPHPPGNPLFVLLGKVFTLLPIAPTIAMRVNLLAAVSSALAAGPSACCGGGSSARGGVAPVPPRRR